MRAKAVQWILVALLFGCEERERLTFETEPEDTLGPTSSIDPPSRDTTLAEGDPFILGARTVDLSGIATVFIELEGADLTYPPIDAEGADTLTFSINLPTLGLSGRTITVGVFGEDVIGNTGPTVIRRLTIR